MIMYEEIFRYVKEYLENNDGEMTKVGFTTFRKRSEHIKRVYMWAKRLTAGESNLNQEAILVAALFHDIGYAHPLNRKNHAENSAVLCKKYLTEHGYDESLINFVTYLVKNHSHKELMAKKNTPIELVILMEADILDETGALSILWDCMIEGSKEIQSFEKTYHHLLNYSYKIVDNNPMITSKAKCFWDKKQKLTKEFIEQLSFDLGYDEVENI